MRKLLALIVVCLLVTAFAGCGPRPGSVGIDPENVSPDSQTQEVKKSEDGAGEERVDPDEPTSESVPTKPALTIEEQVLVDQDGIKVTVKGFDEGGLFGPSIKLLLENESDVGYTLQARDSSVNDVMIYAMISTDVAPGKKANTTIDLDKTQMEIAGIKTVKDIEFKLVVFNSETWEDILNTDTLYLETDAPSDYVQTYDDSGIVALERDGIKVVVKKLDSEYSFWGAELYLYIENETGKNVTIQTRNTSINGFMMDPIFSCDIIAGKKAFDSITFFESDFESNEIEDIEELELSFTVFQMETWNTLFDSEVITITY